MHISFLSLFLFYNQDFCYILKMFDQISILALCIYTYPEPDFKVVWSGTLYPFGQFTEAEDLMFLSFPRSVSWGYEELLDFSLPLIFPSRD